MRLQQKRREPVARPANKKKLDESKNEDPDVVSAESVQTAGVAQRKNVSAAEKQTNAAKTEGDRPKRKNNAEDEPKKNV